MTLALSVNYFIYEPKILDEIENRPLNSNIDFSWSGFLNRSYQSNVENYLSDQFAYRRTAINIYNHYERSFNLLNSPFINKDYIYTHNHILDRISELKPGNNKFKNWIDLSKHLEERGSRLDMYFVRKEHDFCFAKISNYLECKMNIKPIEESLKHINHTFLGKEINPVLAYYKSDHHINRFGAYFIYQHFMKINNYKPISLSNFKFKRKTSFKGTKVKLSGFQGLSDEYFAPKNNKKIKLFIDNEFYKYGYLNTEIKKSEYTNWNKYTETPGYCSCIRPSGDVINYSVNPNPIYRKNILLIGDSQQCGVAFMFYNSFEKVYTMDHRKATNSIRDYVKKYNISHVIYIGNITNTFSNENIQENWLK